MVSHRIELAGVDGVRGAEIPRPVQLLVVGVDGDDPLGADQPGARDRGVAHTAAADHGDRVVAGDRAGVDGRTESGHHPAAQQPGHRGIGGWVDLGALAARAPASCRRTRRCPAPGSARCRRSASSSAAALNVLKQYQARPRLQARHSPHTARQFRITKSPGLDVCDALADGLDGARGLVPEQERELVVDAALAVVSGRCGRRRRRWTSTTTSPGPGSGMTTSTTSTGFTLLP